MVIENADVTDRVRVICYVPVRTNQILQAHASLEGVTKQDLLGGILVKHAETLEVAGLKKETEKPVQKVARKKRKKVSENVSDQLANDIEG